MGGTECESTPKKAVIHFFFAFIKIKLLIQNTNNIHDIYTS